MINFQKQGGRLSDDMSTSRFVVLTTRSKQFDKLKKEAVIHHKKRPLKPAFIRACIDAQRIVNESDYRFEDEIADPKPRGRPRKSERKSSNSSPRTGRKPKAAFAPGAAYDDPRLRSPTPPTKVVVMTPGKNAFSPEERRYVINFARCAFRRDPLLSYTALASMLGARVSTAFHQCDGRRSLTSDSISCCRFCRTPRAHGRTTCLSEKKR